MELESNLNCPSCSKALRPKVLACDQCEVAVEGKFHFNEFATLGPEDLHFLRIFVQAEGKVREMETALGLSYPTIRARIAELKNKIAPTSENAKAAPAADKTIQDVLKNLEQKKIGFDEAMKRIRRLRHENRN